jgi:hypothetical protein
MSELGTFYPSPGTLACGIGLKQVVQFRPYRFWRAARIRQQLDDTVDQRDVAHRPIDLRHRLTLPVLTLGGQGRLHRFSQDAFQAGQEDHPVEVLLYRGEGCPTEVLQLKDVLDPVKIGLLPPAPAMTSLNSSRG